MSVLQASLKVWWQNKYKQKSCSTPPALEKTHVRYNSAGTDVVDNPTNASARDQISVMMSHVTLCRLVRQTTNTKAADKLGQSLHKLMRQERTPDYKELTHFLLHLSKGHNNEQKKPRP